jgi:hypothetical protein
MRAQSICASLLLLPTLAAAPAPETYTIKLKQFPELGKSVTIKESLTSSSSLKYLDADGKVVNEKKPETTTHKTVYIETVLEKGNKRPKKFKQTYQKAVIVSEDKTKNKELSFQGRTIICELKNEKYDVTVEGDKPLSKADLASLKQHANNPDLDQLLTPKQPVKVKDPWKLDVAKAARSFGIIGGIDLEKSKAEAQLVKAYKKESKRCGVLQLSLLLVTKKMPEAKSDASSTTDIKVTLDTSLDASDSARSMIITFKMKGKESVDMMGKKLTMEMIYDMTFKVERSSEK